MNDSPTAVATAHVVKGMATAIDALLASLVAEGGALARQTRPDGTDLYYVDGVLRLKLGPIVSDPPAAERGGTMLRFTRSVTRYPRPE